jgi:hypothetical protein
VLQSAWHMRSVDGRLFLAILNSVSLQPLCTVDHCRPCILFTVVASQCRGICCCCGLCFRLSWSCVACTGQLQPNDNTVTLHASSKLQFQHEPCSTTGCYQCCTLVALQQNLGL